jgi:hypothetical protein
MAGAAARQQTYAAAASHAAHQLFTLALDRVQCNAVC